MCENTGIGKWAVFYRLWRFSRKFKGSKSTPYFSFLLILLVTHTYYIYAYIYEYVYIYSVCVQMCVHIYENIILLYLTGNTR